MDGMMMDWLYDELDPSSSAKVAQHVDGCSRCSTEMAALRRTRAAFRGISHLEPPPGISAILLHEAARRAPAAAAARGVAGESLWQRLRAWLRPLGNHPAVTAMASLILVAGVAGALYVRKGWDIGAPHDVPDTMPGGASTAAAPPAPPEKPVFEDEGAGGGGDKGESAEKNGRYAAGPEPKQSRSPAAPPPEPSAGGERGDGFAAGLLDGEKEADLRQAEYAQAPEERSRRRQVQASRAAESQTKDAAKKSIASPDPADQKVNKRGIDPAAADVLASEGRSESTLARNRVGSAAPAREPESVAPGGTPATTGKTDSDDSAGNAGPLEQQALSKSEQGWLTVQEQRLTALVRGKRCREAAAVANDILDRNPAYYVRRIRDSKDVEPCRRYVGDEQKRRAARRAKPATSKGAGAAQKAKAAPARDEAAAEQSAD